MDGNYAPVGFSIYILSVVYQIDNIKLIRPFIKLRTATVLLNQPVMVRGILHLKALL
jgi:hypothetical protein